MSYLRFLCWMTQSSAVLREAVEACSFKVVLPGYNVIETGAETKSIDFMCAGSVLIEDLYNPEEESDDEEYNVYRAVLMTWMRSGGWGSILSKFEELVLGCIEAYFCK